MELQTETLNMDAKVKVLCKVCPFEVYLDMWLVNKVLEDFFFEVMLSKVKLKSKPKKK